MNTSRSRVIVRIDKPEDDVLYYNDVSDGAIFLTENSPYIRLSSAAYLDISNQAVCQVPKGTTSKVYFGPVKIPEEVTISIK